MKNISKMMDTNMDDRNACIRKTISSKSSILLNGNYVYVIYNHWKDKCSRYVQMPFQQSAESIFFL